ncbi:MAG: bifunctional phosphoribosylaminoimidazolecarboxamide formyltransferase/IMP cyclohydrolase [Candidatus Omnitrophota bacterium]|nr:bifunctional phosphoribosylaminoimidazolecarboxamide formyltransferase/IMP cyclohydrolase [Candidatus Omnitrophota bacterium]
MVTVKRALLSCADKTGLDAFAKELTTLGVELVASGGTADFLKAQGLPVKTVETFAGITEQLDGRVKTLHPKIHAGILARRDNPAHVQSVGAGGLIDLVVVNLYPFAHTVRQPGRSLGDVIEQIDVGGVALLRAAAKNFQHVASVCEPRQYGEVLAALRAGRGQLPEALTHQLAVEAFEVTSRYDTLIAEFLGSPRSNLLERGEQNSHAASSQAQPGASALPDQTAATVRKRQALRYGENPHQRGGWYVSSSGSPWGLGTLRQLQGKELSYNNFLDVDAALRCLLEFTEPTCVIVKHTMPCGVASASPVTLAYDRAYACDPESAFGGIVGINQPVDQGLAEHLVSTFLEVVLAPSVEPAAAGILANKPNLRVVILTWPAKRPAELQWRHLLGGWLLQDPDLQMETADALKLATKRAPTEPERADLLFAWKTAKHAASNSIVLVRDRATVGIGQGQPSRVASVRLALQHAGERSKGSVAASDGFFPFPDSVEWLARAGVRAVIQPGGSIRDAEVVAAADAANLAMVFTGIRHFRH